MKTSETKKAFLCLLSQVLYTAVIALLLVLRRLLKVPLLGEIIALIGMGTAFLWPVVSGITGAASVVFAILAWKKKESIVFNALILMVAIILMALAVLYAKSVMRNMFYG